MAFSDVLKLRRNTARFCKRTSAAWITRRRAILEQHCGFDVVGAIVWFRIGHIFCVGLQNSQSLLSERNVLEVEGQDVERRTELYRCAGGDLEAGVKPDRDARSGVTVLGQVQ